MAVTVTVSHIVLVSTPETLAVITSVDTTVAHWIASAGLTLEYSKDVIVSVSVVKTVTHDLSTFSVRLSSTNHCTQ